MVRLLCGDTALQREHLKNFSAGLRLGRNLAARKIAIAAARAMPKMTSGVTELSPYA
jgi:hypothetical protein